MPNVEANGVRQRGALESDLRPLRELLDALYRAIADRDPDQVWRLLDEPTAVHLPARVREEAVVVSRTPVGSFRAPLFLLQFVHVMQQLEGLPLTRLARDPDQLELPFNPVRRRRSA
jgi:hypothetical protein